MKALRVNAVTDPTVTSPASVMFYQNLSGFGAGRGYWPTVSMTRAREVNEIPCWV